MKKIAIITGLILFSGCGLSDKREKQYVEHIEFLRNHIYTVHNQFDTCYKYTRIWQRRAIRLHFICDSLQKEVDSLKKSR